MSQPDIVVLKTRRDEVVEDVVNLANDVIDRARRGEVRGLAVALVMDDGSTWTNSAKSCQRHALLAGILDLLIDVQRAPTS